MRRVIDMTGSVSIADARPRRRNPSRINVHRFGGDKAWWDEWAPGRDAAAIDFFFRHKDHGSTSRRMPYGFFVWEDGRIEQSLPLQFWGPDARGWSEDAYAVAVIGDFRKKPPTQIQFESLIDLCVGLTIEGNFGGKHISIEGHTNMPDASHNPNHVCPGKHLDLQLLRHEVNERTGCIKSTFKDIWGFKR